MNRRGVSSAITRTRRSSPNTMISAPKSRRCGSIISGVFALTRALIV